MTEDEQSERELKIKDANETVKVDRFIIAERETKLNADKELRDRLVSALGEIGARTRWAHVFDTIKIQESEMDECLAALARRVKELDELLKS